MAIGIQVMSRRGWRQFLMMMPVGATCGFLLAAAVTFFMPEIHESRAVIEVKPLSHQSALKSDTPEGEAPPWLLDEIGRMRSREILDRVIDRLDLEKRWDFGNEEIRRELAKSMEIMSIRGSDLVSIRVRHTDKVAARDVALEIARAYQAYRNNLRRLESKRRLDDLRVAIKDEEYVLNERILAFDAIDRKRRKNLQVRGSETLLHLPESQEFADAKRELESAEARLSTLRRFEMVEGISWNLPGNSAPIHEEPVIGGSPVFPNVRLNLALGTLGGFLLAPLGALPAIRRRGRDEPVSPSFL